MRRSSLALLGLVLASCGGAAAIDRAAVYSEIGVSVAAPSYVELEARTSALDAAAVAYCADAANTTKLDTLRTALVDAHQAYQRTKVFELATSPVNTAQIPLYLDAFPLTITSGTTTTTITDVLTNTYAIDLPTLPAKLQGFYAVEYAIYEQPVLADAAAQFTNGALGTRRCQYLLALTARIDVLAGQALATWSPSSDTTFDHALSHPGSAGSPYATLRAATTDLVVRLYTLLESLADMRLGAPLGVLSVGATTPDPSAAPGHLGHLTKGDLLAAMDGFEGMYNGTYAGGVDVRGIGDLVHERSAARDQEVKDRIAAARAAIEAIPGSVDQSVVDPQSGSYAAVLAAYDALKMLQATIATSVGPLLGISSAAFLLDGD